MQATEVTKLEVSIFGGNSAMLAVEDFAAALRSVADKMDSGETSGRIRDANGNRVGTWSTSTDD